mgnify:CR=1 FL=1
MAYIYEIFANDLNRRSAALSDLEYLQDAASCGGKHEPVWTEEELLTLGLDDTWT